MINVTADNTNKGVLTLNLELAFFLRYLEIVNTFMEKMYAS